MEEDNQNSGLPEEILVSIVPRFPLGDAVRTSVLSKGWRYIWTRTIRALNFDANEMQSKHLLSTPSGGVYSSGEWGSADGYNYSEWVSGVLAQLRGSNVDEFRICYDLDRRYTSRIDEWIRFALSNGLHKLELSLSRKRVRRYMMDHDEWHETFYTLQHPVWMSYNVFVGFKSLKILSLNAVHVDDEVVEYLLSNCPLLERLSLQQIGGLRNVKVAGPSLLLSHLEVVACWDVTTIEICDTNLVSFTIASSYGYPKLLIENSPQLVEICYKNGGIIWYMLSQFSCIYSQLQTLQLTSHHSEEDGYWEYPMPELENLKQFTLVLDPVDGGTLLGYLTIIRNWPNLERFVLQLKYRRIDDTDTESIVTEAYVELREQVKFCHPCLKVFEISGYCHTHHFDLFEQIIANAVALEKIVLELRAPDQVDDREFQSGEEQQLRGLLPPTVQLVVL